MKALAVGFEFVIGMMVTRIRMVEWFCVVGGRISMMESELFEGIQTTPLSAYLLDTKATVSSGEMYRKTTNPTVL